MQLAPPQSQQEWRDTSLLDLELCIVAGYAVPLPAHVQHSGLPFTCCRNIMSHKVFCVQVSHHTHSRHSRADCFVEMIGDIWLASIAAGWFSAGCALPAGLLLVACHQPHGRGEEEGDHSQSQAESQGRAGRQEAAVSRPSRCLWSSSVWHAQASLDQWCPHREGEHVLSKQICMFNVVIGCSAVGSLCCTMFLQCVDHMECASSICQLRP